MLTCEDLREQDDYIVRLLPRYLHSEDEMMLDLLLRGLLKMCDGRRRVSRGQPFQAMLAARGWAKGCWVTQAAWALLSSGSCWDLLTALLPPHVFVRVLGGSPVAPVPRGSSVGFNSLSVFASAAFLASQHGAVFHTGKENCIPAVRHLGSPEA